MSPEHAELSIDRASQTKPLDQGVTSKLEVFECPTGGYSSGKSCNPMRRAAATIEQDLVPSARSGAPKQWYSVGQLTSDLELVYRKPACGVLNIRNASYQWSLTTGILWPQKLPNEVNLVHWKLWRESESLAPAAGCRAFHETFWLGKPEASSELLPT